jgi:hypothetical protein
MEVRDFYFWPFFVGISSIYLQFFAFFYAHLHCCAIACIAFTCCFNKVLPAFAALQLLPWIPKQQLVPVAAIKVTIHSICNKLDVDNDVSFFFGNGHY